MKEFFNLLKANGMIMNLVFFTKRLPTFGSLFVLWSGWQQKSSLPAASLFSKSRH